MKNSKGRIIMCLSLILILSIAILSSANAAFFGLFGSKKNEEAKKATVINSLLVFPFDQDSTMGLPDEFGQAVADDIKSMLKSDAKYQVYLFRERLSPINRAKSENILKPGDTQPPFSEDMNKPMTLAKLLAMDYVLVGSIDEYKADVAQKSAMVTLSVQLYDAKTNKQVKTIVVTGKALDSNASTEDELRDLAKGDAVTRLIGEITANNNKESQSAAVNANPTSTPEPKK